MKKFVAGGFTLALAATLVVPAFAADAQSELPEVVAYRACLDKEVEAAKKYIEDEEIAFEKAVSQCETERVAADKARKEAAEKAKQQEAPKVDNTPIKDLNDLKKLSEKELADLVAKAYAGDPSALIKLGLKDPKPLPKLDPNSVKAAQLEKAYNEAVKAKELACKAEPDGRIMNAEGCLAAIRKVEDARQAIIDFGKVAHEGAAPTVTEKPKADINKIKEADAKAKKLGRKALPKAGA